MPDNFDREKVVDCMFDPITSAILAELEDGTKELTYLATKVSISETEVREHLSYLIEHQFVIEVLNDDKPTFSANTEKLTKIIEDGDNFDSAVDGLTKLDSYLN